MHLTTERLKAFYSEQNVKSKGTPLQKIHHFQKHPLLESCLASLIPYFDVPGKFPENIASMKIKEAITILRTIEPEIDDVLINYDDPGKIDLTDFMEKNYMFNMPLEKFGYLTGRSLATFNRDFKKTFRTTPQKWLTKKRLDLAFYQLKQKQHRPVDVYLEVGFENLSHFSYAFKKQFGYAPTAVR